MRSTLVDCKESHEDRVALLRDRIAQLGGSPADGSGPWGAFAKLVEGGAKIAGDDAAIYALEEGEAYGLNDYGRDPPKLDSGARDLVEHALLPAQRRTHRALSGLEHSLTTA